MPDSAPRRYLAGGVTTARTAGGMEPYASPLVLLALPNLALLVVGCLMEMYSAIIVVVPLIIPLGLQFHVDPVQLGVIFPVNLELGFLHPPVGIDLFLASYRFQRPIGEIVWAVLPMLAVVGTAVVLVTYRPALTHWLPAHLSTLK
jgi:C4-dicarboxylate transporter DctM subunit